MGEVYSKRRGGEGNRDCCAKLWNIFVEFGFLCAPGILFEPVSRVRIRLRDEAEAFATEKAYQKSINGSISLLGVPCSHSRALGRRISWGSLVSSNFFLVSSRYLEETWFIISR
jgi:hypothetical protein